MAFSIAKYVIQFVRNRLLPFRDYKRSRHATHALSQRGVTLGPRSIYPPFRDALNPQNLEISPEFPGFPDFELRSPERSQKSGISLHLYGKSPECTGIALKMNQKHVFHFQFVWNACLHRSVSREAGLLNGAA